MFGSPQVAGMAIFVVVLGLSASAARADSFDARWLAPSAQPDLAPRETTGQQPGQAADPKPEQPQHGAGEQGKAARLPDAGPPVPKKTIVGRASYYAYRGGKTASGRPFDANALTAAHRTLPFGTRLRVTNLKTHKSVEVLITDRGPASKSRVLDLSAAAARALGMSGVATVRAEVIGG
jgi:rare lipoprotein A